MTTDLWILLAIISGVIICILIGTCCCLLHFITKNRTLVNEKKHHTKNKNGAQQPLNKLHNNSNNKMTQNIPKQSQIGTTSNTSTVISGQVHTNHQGITPNDLNTTLSNGQYSDFDPDFLVHPEINYLSASQSQASNSNSIINQFNNRMPHAPHNNNHILNATVTASTSIEDIRSGYPLPLHLNHSNHTNPSPNSQYIISQQMMKHQMEQQKKLDAQRHRLQDIVSNAPNKLQQIAPNHISFEEEVGKGKFGKVFRALWTDTRTMTQKTVAVKWFKQDEVDQEVFEDFLKEIC